MGYNEKQHFKSFQGIISVNNRLFGAGNEPLHVLARLKREDVLYSYLPWSVTKTETRACPVIQTHDSIESVMKTVDRIWLKLR